jgi:hypothetical protein
MSKKEWKIGQKFLANWPSQNIWTKDSNDIPRPVIFCRQSNFLLFFSNKDSDHLQSDSNADYTSSGVYEEDLSHSGGRDNSNGEGHAHGRIHQSPDTHESSNSDWTKDLDTPPIPVATQGGGGGGGASVIFKVSY